MIDQDNFSIFSQQIIPCRQDSDLMSFREDPVQLDLFPVSPWLFFKLSPPALPRGSLLPILFPSLQVSLCPSGPCTVRSLFAQVSLFFSNSGHYCQKKKGL